MLRVVLAEPGEVFHRLHGDGSFPRVWYAGVFESVAVIVISDDGFGGGEGDCVSVRDDLVYAD